MTVQTRRRLRRDSGGARHIIVGAMSAPAARRRVNAKNAASAIDRSACQNVPEDPSDIGERKAPHFRPRRQEATGHVPPMRGPAFSDHYEGESAAVASTP